MRIIITDEGIKTIKDLSFTINKEKKEKNDNLIKNKNKRINNTFKFLIIITKQINIKSQTIQS